MEIMSVTTNETGQNNIWPKETQPYVSEDYYQKYGLQTHNERAEIYNSRAAMLGIVAAVISYVATGKLFFGII